MSGVLLGVRVGDTVGIAATVLVGVGVVIGGGEFVQEASKMRQKSM